MYIGFKKDLFLVERQCDETFYLNNIMIETFLFEIIMNNVL